MKLHNKFALSVLGLIAILFGVIFVSNQRASAYQITFSPIKQEKILVPGTTDYLTINLSSPSDSEGVANYELEVRPFSVDENNNTVYEAKEDYSQIVDWISLPESEKTGSLKANERKTINFTVTVPKNAPAGGQYAAIIIKTYDDSDSGFKQVYELSHRVFAEVAGETLHQGGVVSTIFPSFLLSGNLTAGATIKNEGNVHASARHTLKVSPLFGGEELFTNEEDKNKDDSNIIMPGSTRYTSVTWDQTPSIGIFRVSYTVEFEGIKNETEKIVVICPLWLIVVIFAIILIFIYRIFTRTPKKEKEA